jgi:hypothetical protein
VYELDVLRRDGEACLFPRFPYQTGDGGFPLAVAGQEVPGVRRESGAGVTQTEEDPAVLVLEMEVDTDDVKLGPCRGLTRQRTGTVRRS